MVHPDHPGLPYTLLKQLMTSAGGAVAMLTFFIVFQYIIKFDFVCPCVPGFYNSLYCWLYIGLPFAIMSLVSVVTDPGCKSTCKRDGCRGIHLQSIMTGFIIGSLWLIMALIDGDWFVCLMATNVTAEGQQIACVEKIDQTAEQQATINCYVNESRVAGMVMILAIACYHLYQTCQRKPYLDSKYEEYLEKQKDAILEKVLREQAAEEAQCWIQGFQLKRKPAQPAEQAVSFFQTLLSYLAQYFSQQPSNPQDKNIEMKNFPAATEATPLLQASKKPSE